MYSYVLISNNGKLNQMKAFDGSAQNGGIDAEGISNISSIRYINLGKFQWKTVPGLHDIYEIPSHPKPNLFPPIMMSGFKR